MWWQDQFLRRGGSDSTGRLELLVKLIYVSTLALPRPLLRTQKLWCLKKKKKINPMKKYNCFISWFLFKISGWYCLCLETTWLEYIIFQNLLQGNLCYLFCCSGNLFLVLNELTKIEFMALSSIEAELRHFPRNKIPVWSIFTRGPIIAFIYYWELIFPVM